MARVTWIPVLLLVLAATPAIGHDDLWRIAEDNAAWRSECGVCHMAFPPGMLPAEDWQLIMRKLDRHYGADASLDERVRSEISAFLERNGSKAMFFGSGDELPRITATGWFERKHQGAIRMWRKGRVKSLADCQACHPGSG